MQKTKSSKTSNKAYYLILTLIILISIFLRSYNMHLPSPYPDEVALGQRAQELRYGEKEGIFYHDHPPLFMLLYATSLNFIEDLIAAGRVISIVTGILTTITIYLLTRALYNKNTALLATFTATTLSFHVLYSRIAQIDSLLLFIIIAFYAIFALSEKHNSIKLKILSGILLGIACWTKYISFGILVCLGFYYLIKERNLKFLLKKEFLSLIITFIIIILPIAIFNAQAIIWQTVTRFDAENAMNIDRTLIDSIILFTGYLGGSIVNIQHFPKTVWDYVGLSFGIIPFLFAMLYFIKPLTENKKAIRNKSKNKQPITPDYLIFIHTILFSIFFTLYSVKFQYYLLMIILPLIPTISKVVLDFNKSLKKSKNPIIVTLIIGFIFLLSLNSYKSFAITKEGGQFDGFREAIDYVNYNIASNYNQEELSSQVSILASHERLVTYHLKRNNLDNIQLILFRDSLKDASSDMIPIIKENTKALIIKKNYYDYYLDEEKMQEIETLFPVKKILGEPSFEVLLLLRE